MIKAFTDHKPEHGTRRCHSYTVSRHMFISHESEYDRVHCITYSVQNDDVTAVTQSSANTMEIESTSSTRFL